MVPTKSFFSLSFLLSSMKHDQRDLLHPPASRGGNPYHVLTTVSWRCLDNHEQKYRLWIGDHYFLLHRNFAQSEFLPDSSFCFLTQHSSFNAPSRSQFKHKYGRYGRIFSRGNYIETVYILKISKFSKNQLLSR